MLKTENPIIFTYFEDESYFSCLTFTNNKSVLFSASAKWWVICVDACIIFRYFLILCLRIFLLRDQIMQHLYGVQSSASTNKSLTNIPAQPTHLQQNFALLQLTIWRCQMKYSLWYGMVPHTLVGQRDLKWKKIYIYTKCMINSWKYLHWFSISLSHTPQLRATANHQQENIENDKYSANLS
jgi:hypothetical protein